MAYIGTCSLAEGKKALLSLVDEIKANKLDWNEAETRFQIIDRIIIDCLGWPRDMIRLEQPQNRKFSDYELGLPRKVIWEAKKEGKIFDLPTNSNKNILCDLASIVEADAEAKEAVEQVQLAFLLRSFRSI